MCLQVRYVLERGVISSKIAGILVHFHYNQLSIFPVQSTELRCLLLIVNSAVKTEPIKTLGHHQNCRLTSMHETNLVGDGLQTHNH